MVEHSNDLAGLVADDRLLFLVVKRGDCKATRVVRLNVEVDISKMREIAMQWIGGHVVAGFVFVLCGKAPS